MSNFRGKKPLSPPCSFDIHLCHNQARGECALCAHLLTVFHIERWKIQDKGQDAMSMIANDRCLKIVDHVDGRYVRNTPIDAHLVVCRHMSRA